MIIEYLELKNFLSHSDSRIEFSPGINVIVGPNGAGKSSLMDGIRFALHGITDRGDLSDLIMHGKNDLSARLGFRLNDRTYEIFRSVTVMKGGNTKSEAEIRTNGMTEATGTKSVNSFVQKIMGINSDTFYSSIFVRQGEIDQLVSQRPADRKKLFSSIIGIDELERISFLIKEMHSAIKGSQEKYFVDPETLESKITEYSSMEEEKNEKTESIKIYVKRRDELSLQLKNAQKEKDDLNQKFFEYKSSRNSLDQKKKESDALKEEIEKLQRQEGSFFEIRERYERLAQDPLYTNRDVIRQISMDLKILEEKKESMKNLAKRAHKAKELKEEVEQLLPFHKEFVALTEEKVRLEEYLAARKKFSEDYRAQLRTLEREMSILEKIKTERENLQRSLPSDIVSIEVTKLQNITDELNGEIQEMKREIGVNQGAIPALESRLKEIVEKETMLKGRNSCPICGTPLTPEHLSEVLHDYDLEISKYENEKKRCIDRASELQMKMKVVSEKLSILNSQNVKRYFKLASEILEKEPLIQELRNTVEKQRFLYDEYEKYEKLHQDLQGKIQSLGEKDDEYRSRKFMYEEYEKQDLENELKKMDSTIEELESACRKSMDELKMDEKTIKDAPARIAEILKNLKELEPRMEKIAEVEKDISTVRAKIAMLDSEVESLKNKVEALKDIPDKIDAFQKELEELQERERENSSELQKAELMVETVQNSMVKLRSEIDLLNERQDRHKKIENALKKLWNIKRSFDKDGIQSYIRRESSEAITEKTRRLASEFGLDIDDVRISEDFDVDVSVEGNVRSLSSLSGGEKTALAIALRLAVADYILSRISLFVLDEPTTFLDEDRRGQLKNILQNSLRDISIVPQLIVITHHQELTKAADTIFSIRKSHGVSIIEAS
ncbi:MAG: AAA family ATPase [Candidatus Thermoplasmatota archaeon]|nr:AAA family ATPase [Candidatus Thermoplasmatota archaeon]